MVIFINHVVQEGLPYTSETRLWLPLSLLADLTIFVVEVQPVPLVVHFSVSSQFIELDLLLMVAAIDEAVEFIFALKAGEPHAGFGTARFECLTSLPALAPGDLVRFHLTPVLFDSSENVQTPIVPHWRPSLDDVIWLRIEPWQVLNGVV